MTIIRKSPSNKQLGDSFEEEVEELYKSLGFRIEKNRGELGHQIDFVALYDLPNGKIYKEAVECKFRSNGTVGINEITPHVNAFDNLLNRRKVHSGTIVTNVHYSKDTWSCADQSDISLLTVGQLQLRVPDETILSGKLQGQDEITLSFIPSDIEFVIVPAGEFIMGSDQSQDSRPTRMVRISKDYQIGKYPVTQREWKSVMEGDNPSPFKGDQVPVHGISWIDCSTFIERLNSMSSEHFRLPTEAEWEYACRGGCMGDYCCGDDEQILMDFARYRDVSDNRAHIVGTLKPNGYGIFDMHGNVWEWCRDLYGPYSSEDKKDPKGPPRGSFRVLRGGAWSSSPKECSSWYRHHAERTASLKTSGFRLIKIT